MDYKMLMIDENRIKHIKAVAEFLYQNTKNQENKNDMYTIGMLHDIGYIVQKENHNHIGGELLKNMGFKYWKEVYYHGDVNPEYQSKELDELNWADMNINSKGENVGFKKRLEDILGRYGKNSNEYKNAYKVYIDLLSKGYN